jgi:uncharacterized protein
MRTDRVLSVADLVGRPGVSRPLNLAFPAPPDLDLPLTAVSDPLRFDGVVESVVEGILVRGTLRAELRVACARCLEEFSEAVAVPLVELFSEPASAQPVAAGEPSEVESGYELRDRQIDLDALVRDALVPAAPLQPRCRPDCAGLCPQCGHNRNQGPCSCLEAPRDSRWAALEALHLPPDRS